MKGLYTVVTFGRLIGRANAPYHRITPSLAPRPHPVAARVDGVAAALSVCAVVSPRASDLDADCVALDYRPAGGAAMGRSRRHVALAAALGGGGRRCKILQPSRRRLGCA